MKGRWRDGEMERWRVAIHLIQRPLRALWLEEDSERRRDGEKERWRDKIL